jgi:hypothetical protein
MITSATSQQIERIIESKPPQPLFDERKSSLAKNCFVAACNYHTGDPKDFLPTPRARQITFS